MKKQSAIEDKQAGILDIFTDEKNPNLETTPPILGPIHKGDTVLIYGATPQSQRWLALILFKTLLGQNLKIGPWKGPDDPGMAISCYYLTPPMGAGKLSEAQIYFNSLCVGTGNPFVPGIFGQAIYDTGMEKIPLNLSLEAHRERLLNHFKFNRNIEVFFLDDVQAFFKNGLSCDDEMLLSWLENLRYIGVTSFFVSQTTEGLPKVFDAAIQLDRVASSDDEGFSLSVTLRTKEKNFEPFSLEVCKKDDYGMCWR